MRVLPLADVYRLLEPGPVTLLITADEGRANVMAMSWHMMLEFEPPGIACIVSANGHSFAALERTGECVIAVPPATMADRVVGIGNCSGRSVDKFDRFDLRRRKADLVAPPLLPECIANIECRVTDRKMIRAYNMFILEAVKAWHDPAKAGAATMHHRGWGEFAFDGEIVRIPSNMR
ncbi:flavin reductase family protein [Zavarzinia compransoris]|uniref:flavin reductase family protein n=1 Tax=Zavarzinia marina TaxID=2911065 RepID=UPI001F464621|nr:flavin reductase family protein [Zavarzinia marina]MCF4165964.1 flavin reductase family protein [Zavarzinia marina]